MSAPHLICDKCSAMPDPKLPPPKPGGTHYVKHAGHRGRNSDYFNRVRTCGKWIERSAEVPDGR